ncbi:MAG: hypothetical protein ACYTEP_02125 [Planctomycetota bacterium]|jgi:hypothetical protein
MNPYSWMSILQARSSIPASDAQEINWKAIAAVGEIAGALGVILSLIYLGRQIRHQNRESRIASVNELTRQWNDFLGVLTEHRDLCETWLKGMTSFHDLDPPRLVQFSACIGRLFRIYESLWQHNQEERLTEEMWHGVESAMQDAMSYPGVRAWWPTRAHWYHTAFIEHIDQRFAEITDGPSVYREKSVKEDADWRLFGQRKYLQAADLEWRAYAPASANPNRDHDHCEFCSATFTVEKGKDTLQEGFVTADGERWVCRSCFEDFHEPFAWSVEKMPLPQ